jgi:hypothetical protein
VLGAAIGHDSWIVSSLVLGFAERRRRPFLRFFTISYDLRHVLKLLLHAV